MYWIVKTRFRTMVATLLWFFSPLASLLLFVRLGPSSSWLLSPLLMGIAFFTGSFPMLVWLADKHYQEPDESLTIRLRNWVNSLSEKG